MKTKFFLFSVSILVILGFVWGKELADVVQPIGNEPYFPTETLTDNQGAVVVEVTQLNLNGADETLDFQVAINTHSVDLSMDLAEVAVLTTETGLTITPLAWDAPRGGHHVSGILTFPSLVDDQAVLEDVTEITLTIRDIDVPERHFVWTLKAGT